MQTQNQHSAIPTHTSHVINESAMQTYKMSEKAQLLAKEFVSRKSLLVALSENQCFSDAIMLLSYAMPRQKGLEWALKCVQNASFLNRTPISTSSERTLKAAEKWINEPTEKNRAAILPTTSVAQPTAATWLAMATYWSGGCISESPIIEEAGKTDAPIGLVNDTIYSSVMLSVQESEKGRQLLAYDDAINQGIQLLFA